MTQDLALYIHVPFCRQRCSYCHFDVKIFHPRTSSDLYVNAYLDTLSQEIAFYSEHSRSALVRTIFFGGGTPSRLEPGAVERCLVDLRKGFAIDEDCEISMEINPEDVDEEKLRAFQTAGITRVSFGVQSFDDKVLQAVNRAHSALTAFKVIRSSPRFKHGISLDLILGLPFQDMSSLERDLEITTELDPDHLSLYMLERDVPTPLDKLTEFHADEDLQADLYERVRSFLKGQGYLHYEISNFAKPGKQCRHNLVYWRCGDYLGLGPAAHGRLNLSYYGNHGRLAGWQKLVGQNGCGVLTRETWSLDRKRQEQIVQGLRLCEGVPLNLMTTAEIAAVTKWLEPGIVRIEADRLSLTDRGQLLANEIFALFVSPEEG